MIAWLRLCVFFFVLAVSLPSTRAAAAAPLAAEPAAPLRICADPDNLPFSSRSDATPGFYIELGRAVADRLGRPFEPVWAPTNFARHEIRTTLLAGQCDGFIGLPDVPDFMGTKLIFSAPLLELGYALVMPRDMVVTRLDDLRGRRVAVQYGSPPQSLLAERADINAVTALSPETAMQALAQGKADTAFIWGPSAGWINKTDLHDAYKIVRVAGEQMQWRSAIGFPHDSVALRDAVNQALPLLASAIDALVAKYGLISDTTMTLADNAGAPADPAGNAGQIAAGHQLFNDNCSHCHGPDAIQGVRRINLRLLHHRYGDRMDEVFLTTVTHGRLPQGMPNWSGILNDAQFHDILAFLHSVQEP
jgi:ABC-type amino acid transport substrate-binding protein